MTLPRQPLGFHASLSQSWLFRKPLGWYIQEPALGQFTPSTFPGQNHSIDSKGINARSTTPCLGQVIQAKLNDHLLLFSSLLLRPEASNPSPFEIPKAFTRFTTLNFERTRPFGETLQRQESTDVELNDLAKQSSLSNEPDLDNQLAVESNNDKQNLLRREQTTFDEDLLVDVDDPSDVSLHSEPDALLNTEPDSTYQHTASFETPQESSVLYQHDEHRAPSSDASIRPETLPLPSQPGRSPEYEPSFLQRSPEQIGEISPSLDTQNLGEEDETEIFTDGVHQDVEANSEVNAHPFTHPDTQPPAHVQRLLAEEDETELISSTTLDRAEADQAEATGTVSIQQKTDVPEYDSADGDITDVSPSREEADPLPSEQLSQQLAQDTSPTPSSLIQGDAIPVSEDVVDTVAPSIVSPFTKEEESSINEVESTHTLPAQNQSDDTFTPDVNPALAESNDVSMIPAQPQPSNLPSIEIPTFEQYKDVDMDDAIAPRPYHHEDAPSTPDKLVDHIQPLPQTTHFPIPEHPSLDESPKIGSQQIEERRSPYEALQDSPPLLTQSLDSSQISEFPIENQSQIEHPNLPAIASSSVFEALTTAYKSDEEHKTESSPVHGLTSFLQAKFTPLMPSLRYPLGRWDQLQEGIERSRSHADATSAIDSKPEEPIQHQTTTDNVSVDNLPADKITPQIARKAQPVSPENWASIEDLLTSSTPLVQGEEWEEQFPFLSSETNVANESTGAKNVESRAVPPIISATLADRSTEPQIQAKERPGVVSKSLTYLNPIIDAFGLGDEEPDELDEESLEQLAQSLYRRMRDRLLIAQERCGMAVSYPLPWLTVADSNTSTESAPALFRFLPSRASPMAQELPLSKDVDTLTENVYVNLLDRLRYDRERHGF